MTLVEQGCVTLGQIKVQMLSRHLAQLQIQSDVVQDAADLERLEQLRPGLRSELRQAHLPRGGLVGLSFLRHLRGRPRDARLGCYGRNIRYTVYGGRLARPTHWGLARQICGRCTHLFERCPLGGHNCTRFFYLRGLGRPVIRFSGLWTI